MERQRYLRSSVASAITAALLVFSNCALGYMVGPAVSLDKMTELADVVFKGKTISTGQVADSPLNPVQGFDRVATRFQVISVFKGAPAGEVFAFHHYTQGNGGAHYVPQHYEFTNGHSYIVFARRTNSPPIFEALWRNHTSKEDQGVFRAADSLPLTAKSVKEACWLILLALRNSTNADDVVYALRQLDQTSGGRSASSSTPLNDFPREEVVELVRPLFSSRDEDVLRGVIELAGTRNPFMAPDPVYWLVTVGKGHLPGIGSRDPRADNLAARLLSRELAGVADKPANGNIRPLAVRAFGRSAAPELPRNLERWTADPEPQVRQSAIVLLADVPGERSQRLIQAATADGSAEVREGAAQAIGFGQLTELVPALDKLLKDSSPKVTQAAAMTLLSFPISTAGDLLRQNLKDSEYRILFVNALSSSNAAPYLADLQEIITKNLSPAHFWGGRIPSADSWDILFKYVQRRPISEIQSGKVDASLDALEKLQWYSSSEPRDLYAFYLQRGLTDRAKIFRERCRKSFTYDIDYFLKMAEQSPNTYTRE